MKLTFVLSFALLSASGAIPTNPPPANFTSSSLELRSLTRRQPGGVYITTAINWEGEKGFAVQPWDVCIRLDAPWWKTISSVGPDSGNAVVLSEDYNCGASPRTTILYPGNVSAPMVLHFMDSFHEQC